jgi:uncharacterized protein with FMN-binding domain
MRLQSSNLYTFQKSVAGKRRYKTSTIVIAVLSLIGAVGIDLWLNPNALSMFAPTNTVINGGVTTATGLSVESGYGPVQVQITSDNGKLTKIEMVRAISTGGRDAAFPLLIAAAIEANGSNIGNVSQATYTSDAFRKSLDSAIAKIK